MLNFPTPTSRIKVAATLLAGLTAYAGLAGCSADKENGTDGPEKTPTPSATTRTPEALPEGVKPASNIPTKVPNDTKLRKNVLLSTCEKTDKGWSAAGTASNPGKKTVEYEITVFFTTSQATVIETGKTKVEVKPGKDAKWSIKKDFKTAPTMLCVLRGVG